MGLLGALVGDRMKFGNEREQQGSATSLAPGGWVPNAGLPTPDDVVLRGRRLALVDERGRAGNKVEYDSIPLHTITHVSVETAAPRSEDSEWDPTMEDVSRSLDGEGLCHRGLTDQGGDPQALGRCPR